MDLFGRFSRVLIFFLVVSRCGFRCCCWSFLV